MGWTNTAQRQYTPLIKKKPMPEKKYFNRELSWLAFNKRVLEQATNPTYPLLERLKYLSFFSSNLDEFFEIRVAGIMQQADSGLSELSLDGLTPKDQLLAINKETKKLIQQQYHSWKEDILPELKKEGIHFKNRTELNEEEKKWLTAYYKKEIYPVLTPLAIDPSHPFPQLINKALHILVLLENDTHQTAGQNNKPLLAVVPVPRILPRVIEINTKAKKQKGYLFLSEALKIFAQDLFPGHKLKGAWEFRITRNSDLYIREEEIENLLLKIEEELYNLRRGAAVRLEINQQVDEDALKRLLEVIALPPDFVYKIDGPLNLMRLMSAYELIDRPDLKFKSFIPYTPTTFKKNEPIFDVITKNDLLLHHPYESFTPVIDFIEAAVKDPQVFAIKITIYRTSKDSPILKTLRKASRIGKQVTVLVELKARFDEELNIHWAKRLEEDGVYVVYGMHGLKTHCKCCLIIRQEADGMKRYAHLSTGNYNPKTAKSYTDLSLFTAKNKITEEVAALFNFLTGFSRKIQFKQLLVAPFNLHETFVQLIRNEAKNAKENKKAKIIIKVNNLSDPIIIEELYKASQAGVSIELIVRSICCLIPGLKGTSENIRVRSLLGRYLEHSRIYYFENAPKSPIIYTGSADWMPRNFFKRIEVAFPIETPSHKKHFLEELLPALIGDNVCAKSLQPTGEFCKKQMNKPEQNFQDYMMHYAKNKARS